VVVKANVVAAVGMVEKNVHAQVEKRSEEKPQGSDWERPDVTDIDSNRGDKPRTPIQ
jgi:hypothetical protein